MKDFKPIGYVRPPNLYGYNIDYLPTAMDESLTLLQKMNKLIEYCHQLGLITNDLIGKWNEIVKWLENSLGETVENILKKWLEDGTILELLEGALDDYAKKEWVESRLEQVIEQLKLYVDREIDNIFIKESVRYTIGEGGDFPSLNEAVDALTNKLVSNRASIEWHILKGHELKEQVFLEGVNLSFVTITSEEPTVLVDTRYLKQDINVNVSPDYVVTPVFAVKNGSLPNIDTVFDLCNCGDKANVCGFHLDNSGLRILAGGGVVNATFIGVSAINGSSVVAHGAKANNCGNRAQVVEGGQVETRGDGFRIWNSTLSATRAEAHSCGDVGFNISQGSSAQLNLARANDCGHHNILITSGSQASARSGNFDNALDDCVTVYASSTLDARYASFVGAGASGIVVTRGSTANIEYATTGGKNGGIYANRGSLIDAYGATADNSGTNAVTAGNASIVNFIYGSAKNAEQDALHCTHGSTINAHQAVLTNAGRNGILAYAGDVFANEANVSNATKHGVEATRGGRVVINRGKANDCGERGVMAVQGDVDASYLEALRAGKRGMEATQGGKVNAYTSNATGATEWGYAIYNGGQIVAVDATGTINRTVNEVSRQGIVFS